MKQFIADALRAIANWFENRANYLDVRLHEQLDAALKEASSGGCIPLAEFKVSLGMGQARMNKNVRYNADGTRDWGYKETIESSAKVACWDALNDRRIDLSERFLVGDLKVEEKAELDALEKAVDVALWIYGTPGRQELEGFVQKLKDEGKWVEQ